MKFTHTTSPIQTYASRIIVFLMCVSAFAGFTLGQKTRRTSKIETASALAAPVPIPFPGAANANMTCADLNALHTAGPPNVYAHITTDFELRHEDPPLVAPGETSTFSTGGKWLLTGGASVDLVNRVNVIGYVGGPGPTRNVFDWRSTRLITAVIVRNPAGSNVYLYNPGSRGGPPDGIGLTTIDANEIFYIAFCYELSGGTTAGDGSISGRVVNSYGVGIANARMTVTDAATGETSTALTSPFGYYTIDNLEVGKFYLLRVAHKRYSFAESSKTMTLNDSLVDIDFVANP